jgi:alpha-L-fucosidase 2
VLAFPTAALAAVLAAAAPAPASPTPAAIDWPAFLARQDLVWKRLPRKWEEGAFLGNGLIGAMVFAPEDEGGQALAFQLGRTDVTDHRTGVEPMLAVPRLPIGRLLLQLAGKPIADGGHEGRLALWDAEWSGTVRTDEGSVELRSYVHAEHPVLVVELAARGGERAARFQFRPALAINERLLARPVPLGEEHLNPAPFLDEQPGPGGPVRVSVQRRKAGGEYAVAWQERSLGGGRRLLVLSIADSFPEGFRPLARQQAAASVRRALADGPAKLRRSHRAFWHGYYPLSFVSVPNSRLESFYWIQMYKLASATRGDRPAIDTLGPWYARTPWPGIWWNLNIQLSYWPVYTANRLWLGQSLNGFIDRHEDNLRKNVQPQFRQGGALAVGRMGGPDAVSPATYTGPRGPKNGAHEISNLIWVMHNYFLHVRHNGDPAQVARLYHLLKGAVGYSLARLQPGADGKLHFPEAVSPEFPKTAPDTNYDLALLRWGLETLLKIHPPDDSEAPRWRDTLARLAPYPVGPDGYLIGRGQPLDRSHRHFSHLLMIYPLRLVTGERPGERALIEKSLAHWIGFEGALQGYSFVGASAISSLLGKGQDAERHLDDLIRRFVKPNTMYLEDGPVIETPLAAAQALHEMLLQSWDGVIRVFPAAPASWQDASFHDLRAEGAFLVSAVRRGGRNVWVQVHSLVGEPVRLRVEMPDAQIKAPPGTAEKQPDGSWKLTLARGQKLELRAPGTGPSDWRVSPVPRPVPAAPFGLP